MRTVIAIGCMVAALPLLGQTTTTMTTTTKTTATKTTMSSRPAASRSSRTRVWNDATRLAALLNDAQNQTANVSAATWRTIGNEANVLANRIYAGSGGRAQAREIRTHVREFRSAALKGDAASARTHAAAALPFVYEIIDWAKPAGNPTH